MKEKRNLYPRLALIGIIKNHWFYLPYLLAAGGMAAIFYILNFLTASSRIAAMRGGTTLQEMLFYGVVVFGVFVVIFLFYTNSFLLKVRKREFGLYNVVGMGKWNLARILVWENLIIGVTALVCGLFCGILFSKLAELLMAYILNGEVSLDFSLETDAVVKTVLLFAASFVLLLLRALIEVGKTKPVDLLHSASVGEKPPKANWFLALSGLVILGAAYYIAVTIEDPMRAFLFFFVAVAMVIVATYLLFIAGSVVLCKILQKNKGYYYKAKHFVSVSSMAYRMKRNGAGLASICILSTMVLVMLSATACLYIGEEDQLNSLYRRELALSVYNAEETVYMKIQEEADALLEANHTEQENVLDYRFLAVSGIRAEDQFAFSDEYGLNYIAGSVNLVELYFIPLEDYNRCTGAEESLAAGEALLYMPTGSYGYESITIKDCGSWFVKKVLPEFELRDYYDMVVASVYLIVPGMEDIEAAYQAQLAAYGENASSKMHYYAFDITAGEDVQVTLAGELSARMNELRAEDEEFPWVDVKGREERRAEFYALYGGLFVVGILLGAVFLAAAVLIMYYRQLTEGCEDQTKFDIMQKVGMTGAEIRSNIRSQMFTVFLAPLLAAGVHTAFAFPIVRKLLFLFSFADTGLLIKTTGGCFAVFAVFYTFVYTVTSHSYYRIVSGAGDISRR